tara:strand:- start:17298 stop:19337 length:2040 start_codon:yes stop_codon:yes gene_type:complete
MPYTIPYSDEANNGTITVVDNTINNETSLKFPGKNSTAYGTIIAENFLHLLENFASSTEPVRPSEGQLWYDSTPGAETLKVYDGTAWIPSGGLNRAPTAPDVAFSQSGDLWVDTDNQQLYLNSGSGWVLVGPTFSDGLATGASPLTVTGTDNAEHTVVQIEVNAQPVAIIATDSFTPKAVISGFTTINPGVNLANRNITGSGIPKFYGTAEKAENLIVNNTSVSAGNFLRGDTTSTTLFPINLQNNTGVIIGTDAALNIGVDGQAGIIRHQIEGSNIDIQVKNAGSTKTVLRVDSNLRVGINNEAPDEALDVTGNIQTDSELYINGTTQSSTIGTGSAIIKGGVGIAKNLNVGGTAQILGVTTLANTIPDGNNTRNLGSTTSKWQNMYATTFIGNLTGNVNGTVSGIAGSANKLTSASTFRITGAIVADDITFDGQTGGSLKTFVTRVGNAIISGQETNSIRGTDDLLFNRGDQGLYKVTRNNLLKYVPQLPIGVIMPWAGTILPDDWLLCDGSIVPINDWKLLHEAIGDKFGSRLLVPSGSFKLPDMRGRMPLGADNMGGNPAGVVTSDYATSTGQIGGSESETIAIENLPEHKHNLRSGNTGTGSQFFAVQRGGDELQEDTVYFGLNPADSQISGQGLPNSGGVLIENVADLGVPLNIMPPTVTMSYIIYTGRDQIL